MIPRCRTPSPSKAFVVPWQHLPSLSGLEVHDKQQQHHSELVPMLAQVFIYFLTTCEVGGLDLSSMSGSLQGGIQLIRQGAGKVVRCGFDHTSPSLDSQTLQMLASSLSLSMLQKTDYCKVGAGLLRCWKGVTAVPALHPRTTLSC